MQLLKAFFWMFFVCSGVFLVGTSNACAYIDPGTGSFVVQIVLAVFLGITLTVKAFWDSVKKSIKSLFRSKEE